MLSSGKFRECLHSFNFMYLDWCVLSGVILLILMKLRKWVSVYEFLSSVLMSPNSSDTSLLMLLLENRQEGEEYLIQIWCLTYLQNIWTKQKIPSFSQISEKKSLALWKQVKQLLLCLWRNTHEKVGWHREGRPLLLETWDDPIWLSSPIYNSYTLHNAPILICLNLKFLWHLFLVQ